MGILDFQKIIPKLKTNGESVPRPLCLTILPCVYHSYITSVRCASVFSTDIELHDRSSRSPEPVPAMLHSFDNIGDDVAIEILLFLGLRGTLRMKVYFLHEQPKNSDSGLTLKLSWC